MNNSPLNLIRRKIFDKKKNALVNSLSFIWSCNVEKFAPRHRLSTGQINISYNGRAR